MVFGSLHARINRDNIHVIGKRFSGCTFMNLSWELIADAKLEEILDLRQAGYSSDTIQSVLGISSLPTKKFIFNKLHICLLCERRGHVAVHCDNVNLPNK